MANSEHLEARYSASTEGTASLKEMQPSYPSFQVSRITSGNGGVSERATPSRGTYQRASSGRSSSRAGTSAGHRQPDLVAESAAFSSRDSQTTAVQPAFRNTSRMKTARPGSRDRRTSAWAAPQYTTGEEQQQHSQLDANSWMSGDAFTQSSRAMDRNSQGYKPQPRPLSRQVTAPQEAAIKNDYDQSSCWSTAHKLRPSSAQGHSSAKMSCRPQSRQQDSNHPAPANGSQTTHASAWPHLQTVTRDEQHVSHAMGMTLSQYMSQMPSREAAAGESWARPVSASLTAQDCQPAADQHGLSSVEDDESPGWRDDEHWEYTAGRQTPSPSGLEDATDLTPGSRHLSSARGNGLDLRPATAGGVSGGRGLTEAFPDASSTRQTDLGSLSAQLFAPRPQTQGGCFRPPSRRLSRPSTAQRAAARPTSGHSLHASGSTAAGSQEDAGTQFSQGLVIKGGRKVQSARPSERDQRPPSRQKPPPEALHLFQPVHGSSSGGFAPSPVFRAAAAGTARPSTSASIMQQASPPRFKPSLSPVLHTGRMTLDDLQKLSQAAVSNSQALQLQAPVAAPEEVPISIARTRSSARPPSARPPSAGLSSSRPLSARRPSAGK